MGNYLVTTNTTQPWEGWHFSIISQLYGGSISDREIVVRSRLLDLPFQEKDSIIADKGFTMQDLLPLQVSLNIPPFLGSFAQMPANDVVRTQEIASLRIHVELNFLNINLKFSTPSFLYFW